MTETNGRTDRRIAYSILNVLLRNRYN